jgi:hypothetical protein
LAQFGHAAAPQRFLQPSRRFAKSISHKKLESEGNLQRLWCDGCLLLLRKKNQFLSHQEGGLMKIATTLILSTGLMFGLPLAQASTHRVKTDIVVAPLATTSELAQQPSEDMLLRADGSGTPYLYLEQQQGARLVVLNVDDLAHVKVVASVETGVNRPFDFVQPISDTLEQIRFRDGSGSALLNLQKAKSPQIVNAEHTVVEPAEALGNSGYLLAVTDSSLRPARIASRDYQVVDFGTRAHPLETIAGVTRIAERSDTGTVFLLGAQGITVIRNLSTEQQYAAEEAVLDHN